MPIQPSAWPPTPTDPGSTAIGAQAEIQEALDAASEI